MQVAAFLKARGFDHVANIAGGINAWSTEVDTSVPAIDHELIFRPQLLAVFTQAHYEHLQTAPHLNGPHRFACMACKGAKPGGSV